MFLYLVFDIDRLTKGRHSLAVLKISYTKTRMKRCQLRVTQKATGKVVLK